MPKLQIRRWDNDRIIYDTDSGDLYYDADGNASGASTLFAHLKAGGTIVDMSTVDPLVTDKIAALDACVVITGHDSLGYFGARYGCKVLGSIIPSFSTAAEATAKDLAELKQLANAKRVKAIFTELGTPADVAEQLAAGDDDRVTTEATVRRLDAKVRSQVRRAATGAAAHVAGAGDRKSVV